MTTEPALPNPRMLVANEPAVRRQSTTHRISVVGCGHVGLVMAAGLSELGHELVGIDIDAALVDRLNRGEVDLLEPELGDVVMRNLNAGRLRFPTGYEA